MDTTSTIRAALPALLLLSCACSMAAQQPPREPVPDPLTQRLVLYGRHDVGLSVFDDQGNALQGALLIVTHRPSNTIFNLTTDQDGVAHQPGAGQWEPSLSGPGNIGFLGWGERLEVVVSHPRFAAEYHELAPFRIRAGRPTPPQMGYGIRLGEDTSGGDGGGGGEGDREWRIKRGPDELDCKQPECPVVNCASVFCGQWTGSTFSAQLGAGQSSKWSQTIEGEMSSSASARLLLYRLSVRSQMSASQTRETEVSRNLRINGSFGGSAGQAIPGQAGKSGRACQRIQIVEIELEEWELRNIPLLVPVNDPRGPLRPRLVWQRTGNTELLQIPTGLCDDFSELEVDSGCPQPEPPSSEGRR